MGLFGHDAAAVLDGGLPKWQRENRPSKPAIRRPRRDDLSPRLPRRPAARRRRPPGNVETQAELVLDARAAGRFTGETPEPRAGMRSGHIPGSASLPYTDLLNADGTFRSPEAIRDRLAQAGVTAAGPS